MGLKNRNNFAALRTVYKLFILVLSSFQAATLYLIRKYKE